jgi:hypothetical protein
MLRQRNSFALVIVLSGALHLASISRAQEMDTERPQKVNEAYKCEEENASFGRRTLQGHTFVLPTGFESAFLTTHFGFVQGFSYLVIEDVEVGGANRIMDLTLAGVMERFRLGVRFSEWFNAFASIEGQVLTGAEPKSALFRGAGASLTWEGGFGNRLFRNERTGTQLAAFIKARGKYGRDLVPFALVEALLAQTEETVDDILEGDLVQVLLSKEDSLTFGAAMSAAQAIGRYVGLQVGLEGLLGGASYQTTYLQQEVMTSANRQVVGIGTAITGSAAPYLPVGILMEYRFRRILSRSPTPKWPILIHPGTGSV